MIRMPSIVKALFLCASFLFLAGLLLACTPAPSKKDAYISSSGAVMALETDRQSCVGSCNAEYDRCASTRAAEQPAARGSFAGILGAEADCKATLRSCLSGCKQR